MISIWVSSEKFWQVFFTFLRHDPSFNLPLLTDRNATRKKERRNAPRSWCTTYTHRTRDGRVKAILPLVLHSCDDAQCYIYLSLDDGILTAVSDACAWLFSQDELLYDSVELFNGKSFYSHHHHHHHAAGEKKNEEKV